MNHSLWDDEPLSGVELNRPVFKIDNQPAFDNVKELVIVIVFVPMVFTFNDAKAHYRAIHLAKGLVVPLVTAGIRESFLVDHL